VPRSLRRPPTPPISCSPPHLLTSPALRSPRPSAPGSYDEAVNARIVRLISKRLAEGGLAMPAPIVSRIYQEIALANTAFRQALKIARVRFPFPYAQLLEMVKVFVILVTPLVILSKTEVTHSVAQAWLNTFWSMLHTFFVAFNFVALTKVAQEMEDPFGVDPNDLPLLSMHDALNFRLERLLHELPPAADFKYNPKSAFSPKAKDGLFSRLGGGGGGGAGFASAAAGLGGAGAGSPPPGGKMSSPTGGGPVKKQLHL
jgi:hypothetical protein